MLVDDYVKNPVWSTKDQRGSLAEPKQISTKTEPETGVDEVGALVDAGFIDNY